MRIPAAHLAALFLLALRLRGAVALTSPLTPAADEVTYDKTGWSIASGKGYVHHGRWAHKAPLYSAFLAGIYTLAGRSWPAVRMVQAVLGASVCLLVAAAGWMLAGRLPGLVGGWLAALYPPFLLLTARLLSENLFVWFVLLALCALLVLKVLHFWSPFDWEISGSPQGRYSGGYVFLLPFAAAGFLWARRYRPQADRICAALVLCWFGFSILFAGTPRYRLPIEPVLLVLAGAGLSRWLFPQGRSVLPRAGWALGWGGLQWAGSAYSLQAKVLVRSLLERIGIW